MYVCILSTSRENYKHRTKTYTLHILLQTISSSGFHTRIEPANPTPVGIRYPDIIAWKGNTCEIIDTRIWADNFVINEAHSCITPTRH